MMPKGETDIMEIDKIKRKYDKIRGKQIAYVRNAE